MPPGSTCLKKKAESEDDDDEDDDVNFIVDFMNLYYCTLQKLENGYLLDRSPIDDLILVILEYEEETEKSLTEIELNKISCHFYIEYDILYSRYMKKKKDYNVNVNYQM